MTELRGHRIMVVEDDALVALDLETLLLMAGCEVVGPMARVDQALSAAVSMEFDGALLDIHLRGVLVYPVADVLASRRIPFMFLSGYSCHDLPERFGGRPISTKPYIARMLLVKLAGVLDGSGTRQ